MEQGVKPIVPMPVKAKPYRHQIEAFNLAMRLFGITAENAKNTRCDADTALSEPKWEEKAKQKYQGGQK